MLTRSKPLVAAAALAIVAAPSPSSPSSPAQGSYDGGGCDANAPLLPNAKLMRMLNGAGDGDGDNDGEGEGQADAGDAGDDDSDGDGDGDGGDGGPVASLASPSAPAAERMVGAVQVESS
jgi:hypothetical protein